MMFAGVFNPLSLSPALWLDASDAATLLDAGGLAADADEAIATWSDKSGNARHATQATSGSRPTLKAAVKNSRGVVRFDGASDFMTQSYKSIFRNVSGTTVFIVAKPTSSGATERILMTNTNNAGLGRVTVSCDNSAQPSGFHYGGRRLDSDTGDFNQSPSDYDGTSFYAITSQHRCSAAEKQLWINGSSSHVDVAFQTSGNTSDTDSSADTHIGAAAGGASAFFAGDIAEILIFPTALSTTNRQAVESYLNQKWAIY